MNSIREAIMYNSGKIKREQLLEDIKYSNKFDKLELENRISNSVSDLVRGIKNSEFMLNKMSDDDKQELYNFFINKIETVKSIVQDVFDVNDDEVEIVKVATIDNPDDDDNNDNDDDFSDEEMEVN